MRWLVNENVTRTVITELRERGHDVLSVKESMRAEEDEVILARAQAEDRIVVTHDKDFGELAFRSQLRASCGVILFRLAGSHPDTDNERILESDVEGVRAPRMLRHPALSHHFSRAAP